MVKGKCSSIKNKFNTRPILKLFYYKPVSQLTDTGFPLFPNRSTRFNVNVCRPSDRGSVVKFPSVPEPQLAVFPSTVQLNNECSLASHVKRTVALFVVRGVLLVKYAWGPVVSITRRNILTKVHTTKHETYSKFLGII
jgi:hypothetical protein